MDPIPITTTALDSNQENNQLLLNAIKNKFAAQTAHEAASFSPPKFTIPSLKTAGSAPLIPTVTASVGNKQEISGTTNQLNHFLLKQLQEKHSNQELVKDPPGNGFVLPTLQFGNNQQLGSRFDIPLLKTSTANSSTGSGISSLTTAINKLQVAENVITPPLNAHVSPAPVSAIDLSTALASKTSHHQSTPPTRDFQVKPKQQSSADDFEIPFIDCDLVSTAAIAQKLFLASANEYCLTDISKVPLKPSCKLQPSPVGHFLCLVEKHYTPVPLKCLNFTQRNKLKVKHLIQPFQFDKPSPDDKVLEALKKSKSRLYN